MSGVLPGLPGAAADPGTGPVVDGLLERLLADAVPTPPPVHETGNGTVPIARGRAEEALAMHRRHRGSWYGELVGPLRVPVRAVPDVVAGLHRSDHGLQVTLVADAGEPDPYELLRVARGQVMDDDRLEVVGVELPLPPIAPEPAARAALEAVDFTAPAWFVVPTSTAWQPALEVLAEDGAESVALHLPPGTTAGDAAALLRAAVDLDLAVSVTSGELPLVTGAEGFGLLNLLGAVRAALNGAETDLVAGVLAAADEAPLAAAARRMSDADAAVLRAFLPAATCPSVRRVVEDLEAAGLIAPDAA